MPTWYQGDETNPSAAWVLDSHVIGHVAEANRIENIKSLGEADADYFLRYQSPDKNSTNLTPSQKDSILQDAEDQSAVNLSDMNLSSVDEEIYKCFFIQRAVKILKTR